MKTEEIIKHFDKSIIVQYGNVIQEEKFKKGDEKLIKHLYNRLNELMFRYVRKYS